MIHQGLQIQSQQFTVNGFYLVKSVWSGRNTGTIRFGRKIYQKRPIRSTTKAIGKWNCTAL